MGVPYEINPIPDVEVEAGETEVWLEVEFPTRTIISKVVVIQTDGGANDFTVELFNSAKPRDGLPAGVPEEMYLVGNPMVGTNGRLIHFSDDATGGHGLAFFSLDPRPAGRVISVGIPILYIRITVSDGDSISSPGEQPLVFCVGVGGEVQVE